MISEITFCTRFTSFWNDLLPGAKDYMRWVNAGLSISSHDMLPTPKRRHNIAIVNVLAFNIYRMLTRKRESVNSLDMTQFAQGEDYLGCIAQAISYIRRFQDQHAPELPLDSGEIAQAVSIATLLSNRYNEAGFPTLDPMFDGCGIVDPVAGDIYLSGMLIEIKSGWRPFQVIDFRQLIVYCALNHYSRTPLHISRVEMYNPRLGLVFTEEVDTLIYTLSALSPFELYTTIEKFLSEMEYTDPT